MRRRWVFGLLVVAFVWVLFTHYTQVKELSQTLAQARGGWMALAALGQVLYFLVFAISYKAAFWTVEVKSRVIELLPVTLSALFVNVVAPSGGAAGAALFVDDLGQRGQPKSHVTVGAFLQIIADYCAFQFILAVGMIYLFLEHDLTTYEIVGSLILLVIVLGLIGIPALGLWQPEALHRLLTWLQNRANHLARWLKRPHLLAEDWAERTAAEFSQAAAAAASHPLRLARTLTAALGAHLVQILILYLVFRAFGYSIQFWPLVAGFAIGILFLIVSITPQGIGVVEGVMALTFTSLDVPPATAAAVALVFRGITFWIPLVVGFLLLRRVKTFSPQERSLGEKWTVRFIALLTGLMGVINVLSAILPSWSSRLRLLERYSPLFVRQGGQLTVVLAGFALLLLARGLWRRKHTAWWITLFVLGISAISHLLKGLDIEEAALAASLAGWLIWQRDEFHTLSDPPSIRQGYKILAAALGFTLAYGALGFYLLDRHYRAQYDLPAALRQTLVMFTQFYDPGLEPITGFGRYFADSIYIVGLVTLGYAALILLRPVLIHAPASAAEHQCAAEIVTLYGHTSLARMALFPDKAYLFTPGGSLLAYTVCRRVAVVLGDPIGPPQDLSPAIAAFQQLCARNDWIPAFYQTLPETLPSYRQAGFEAQVIGQEAVVDLHTFSLSGHAVKPLRTSANRFSREGYRFVIQPPGLGDDLLETLREVSDEWLTLVHGSEKRFSLGWFDDDYIRSCAIAMVYSPDERLTAFASLLPEYQRNELSVDLMRRRQEVEPGTMDYLFVSLIQYAQQQGYDSFNLGLSALAGVGEQPNDPAAERVLHFIFEHVNQFYNFKGLHEFKEKFQPHWSPRYLIYPNLGALAGVWLAVVEANAGSAPRQLTAGMASSRAARHP